MESHTDDQAKTNPAAPQANDPLLPRPWKPLPPGTPR